MLGTIAVAAPLPIAVARIAEVAALTTDGSRESVAGYHESLHQQHARSIANEAVTLHFPQP